MIDKETENIMVLQKYLVTNPTVQHLSRALTVFHADVLYEDDQMEPVHIPDAEVRFQHSYNRSALVTLDPSRMTSPSPPFALPTTTASGSRIRTSS